MKRIVLLAALVIALGAIALAGCGSGSSLAGTTWTGTVALTSVKVTFESGGQYTSDNFGSGQYKVDGGQVSLVPSGSGSTRVFVLDGSIMQGSVDGWSCTLTKQ
jgi:hypothetical protein